MSDEEEETTPGSAPPPVAALLSALERLPGIVNATSGIQSLQGLEPEHLGFVDFADLPIGALRRSGGGNEGEALVFVTFEIDRSPPSLLGLEFIAWFIRDRSRGGDAVQLRVHGLPPTFGDQLQLGTTLRFAIEWFFQDVGDDLGPVLTELGDFASSLIEATDLYDTSLKERGGPSLLG